MASANTPIIVQSQPTRKNWVDYLFYLIFAGAAIWGGLKLFRYVRAKMGSGKLDDPAHQAASIIYNAKSIWGDDENAAYKAAKQVSEKGVDWKDVSKAFNELYAPETIDNYMNFMSAEEKQKFFNTLNLTQSAVVDPKTGLPAPIKSVHQWTAGLAVITSANTNIRKTAKLTKSTSQKLKDAAFNVFSVFDASSKSNIITVAPKDSVVGIATGRTSFDSNAEPSGVLFVEVSINITAGAKSAASSFTKAGGAKVTKTLNVWVAASQVFPKSMTQITEGGKGKKLVSPYKTFAITQEQYDNTASVSGVTEQPNFQMEVVAMVGADILDGKMRKQMTADSGTILGYPIMTMKNGDVEYVKFQTIAGYNWWVNKKQVVTKQVA